MQFCYRGKEVKLRGESMITSTPLKGRKLNKLMLANTVSEFYHLQVLEERDRQSQSNLPEAIKNLLEQHSEIFQEPQTLPPVKPIDHRIPLDPAAKPVCVRPYRYPQFQKTEIERLLEEMYSTGIIRDSQSPFSSPILLVKKNGSWRFCMDYRGLNSITIKDKFPISTIDEILNELQGARYFSKLDLRSGYHQIWMWEPDIHKTAFRTHMGHYEFIVMPFGLSNAPSTFQATINKVFQPYLRKFVAVFFDDILIYSRSWEAHINHLRTVFSILKSHYFFAKFSKCIFAQESVDYLGHIVSKKGVEVDSKKIQAMVEWPIPTNVKQLREFLGLTGYYRKFVKGYAQIAFPLTELLKKNKLSWGSEAQKSFEKLKTKMTQTPVLMLPHFAKLFVVETDASAVGIGVVLPQEGHPLAYFSRKLPPKLLLTSAYVCKLYAIAQSVHKWRHYLLGRKFVIKTDHKSLKRAHDAGDPNSRATILHFEVNGFSV